MHQQALVGIAGRHAHHPVVQRCGVLRDRVDQILKGDGAIENEPRRLGEGRSRGVAPRRRARRRKDARLDAVERGRGGTRLECAAALRTTSEQDGQKSCRGHKLEPSVGLVQVSSRWWPARAQIRRRPRDNPLQPAETLRWSPPSGEWQETLQPERGYPVRCFDLYLLPQSHSCGGAWELRTALAKYYVRRSILAPL